MNEAKGLVIAGWSAGNAAKTATGAWSGVAQAVGSRLVWLAIFSPVCLVLIGITDGIIRLRRRLRRDNPPGSGNYSVLLRVAPQEAMQRPEEIESVDAPDERQE